MFRIDSIELEDQRRGLDFFYNNLPYVIFLSKFDSNRYNAYCPEGLKLTIHGSGFGTVAVSEKGGILGRVELQLELINFSQNDKVLWWSVDFFERQVAGPIIVPPSIEEVRICLGCCKKKQVKYITLEKYYQDYLNDICQVINWSDNLIECQFRKYMAPLYGGKYHVIVKPSPEIPQEPQVEELGKTYFYIDDGPDPMFKILYRKPGEAFKMIDKNIPSMPVQDASYEFTPTSGIWIYPDTKPTELILRDRDTYYDIKYEWGGAKVKDQEILLRYYSYLTYENGDPIPSDVLVISGETPNLESPFPGTAIPQIPQLDLNRFEDESIISQNRVGWNPIFPCVGLRTIGLTYYLEIIRELPIDIKGLECKIYTADSGTAYDDRFSLMVKKGSRWRGENTWFTIPVSELGSRNDFWGSRELKCYNFYIDPNEDETIIRLIHEDISSETGDTSLPSHTLYIGFGGSLRASDFNLPGDLINPVLDPYYPFFAVEQSQYQNAPSDGFIIGFYGSYLEIKIRKFI